MSDTLEGAPSRTVTMTRAATAREVIGRPTHGYFPALDGLRAVAVATVMLSHLGAPGFSGGKTGVLVFFTLSGFLITSILMRELGQTGAVSFRRFYIRRFLRLLPAMIVVIAATAVLALVWPSNPASGASLRSIPYALLYVVNWTQVAAVDPGWFGHFWSLAVEEQFYLLWPAALFLLWRWKGARAVAWTALAGAMTSVLVKQLADYAPGRHAGTDFAADALLLGAGLAAVLSRNDAWVRVAARILFWPAIVGVVAALTLGDSGSASSTFQYRLFGQVWWPVVSVSSAVIIAALVCASAPRWVGQILTWGPIAYLGRISYGMYLWHIALLAVISSDLNPLHDSPLARLVLLFASTIAIASASFELVERPFLRKKRTYERAGR
jgi:peptidoglycan/LPS O-acetylase OafA/YrhL